MLVPIRRTTIFAALRFRPINPMVQRVAKEDYRLAAGAPHETLIRKGTSVFALTWSAMFDPRVLDAPEEFRPDRPDYDYLHFASGCMPATADTSAGFRSRRSSSPC